MNIVISKISVAVGRSRALLGKVAKSKDFTDYDNKYHAAWKKRSSEKMVYRTPKTPAVGISDQLLRIENLLKLISVKVL